MNQRLRRSPPDAVYTPIDVTSAQEIVATTTDLRGVDRIEHLEKGYSHDLKYILWESADPKYLLRLCDIKTIDRLRFQFEVITEHYRSGIPCPEPLAVGATGDGKMSYLILRYLEGTTAEEALPGLPEKRQFDIGMIAGRWLRRLHEFPCTLGDFDWPASRRAKYARYRSQARELGLTFAGQTTVEKYIATFDHILDEAPVRFQHDDYHPANLIVENGELVGIIDFDRYDWGDPVEDFYKVPMFSVPVSTAFSKGQVEGYLSGRTVKQFWKRYNLYVAMSLHGSLVWGYREPKSSVEFFQMIANRITETHDFGNGEPPSWFS